MKRHLIRNRIVLIVIIFVAVILGLLAFHQICLRIEEKKYPPIGTLVDVNGHRMHVYTEGSGTDTLVFLSGSGTAAPALDFRALYRKLSERYRIAVPERAGYGFSEKADSPRDIDTVLEETRTALSRAGENGPYILFAHSLSGIEALYWAQKYPEEIKAIVGLDAAVPPYYLAIDPQTLAEAADRMARNSLLYRAGLSRFQPSIYSSDPAMTGDTLSADEKKMYKAVVIRSYMSSNMVEEARFAHKNAAVVDALEKPIETPVLYFISDETEVGAGWRDTVTAYLAPFTRGKYVFLDCGHYVHDAMPDEIAAQSITFIQSLSAPQP